MYSNYVSKNIIIYNYTYQSIYLSIYPSIHLSIHLSIYPSFHLFKLDGTYWALRERVSWQGTLSPAPALSTPAASPGRLDLGIRAVMWGMWEATSTSLPSQVRELT